MKELSPNKAIAALEENVIFRFRDLKPTLGVIIKKNAAPDEISYLTSLSNMAAIYNARIEVAEVSNMVDASKAILAYKSSSIICGIIILSDFGKAQQQLYDLIPTRLDLDGTSTMSIGKLLTDDDPLAYRKAPCAAVAALKIMSYEDVDLTGKNVAVFGRSLRVGRPIAEIFTQQNATVTLFHSKSKIPKLDNYDIVIAGIGQPEYINPTFWTANGNLGKTKYIIDIGINVLNGKICGDIAIKDFEGYDVSITPVPGGISKMATVVLMSKLFTNAAIIAGELNE